MSKLFEQILQARGLKGAAAVDFLKPDYEVARHDPFLLPDMQAAVDRLVQAHTAQEPITIYGDYDIDGLSASALLLDAFESFGFQSVDIFIPDRFKDGYGLTLSAVERIVQKGSKLIVTVDCGSLNHVEIARANQLGADVIVTDHHNLTDKKPAAVAVINPKILLKNYPEHYNDLILKKDSSLRGKIYPFLDLAGVGVAFKLIQALQTTLPGLPGGQEKWLLDLVALGTVCDIVSLRDENRANVFWGLKVLSKTRRPGLKALMALAKIEPDKIDARGLGFGLGPRMNAAGRLETAQFALDMLRAKDNQTALSTAQKLDELNQTRRLRQDKIFEQALIQAEQFKHQPVIVVSAPGWSRGIIGIVAAKLLEHFKKPVYVFEENDSEAVGSARSFGDFSAVDGVRAADDLIIKGGGHKAAAGLTLAAKNIAQFRARVNQFYESLQLSNQQALLLPRADATASFSQINLQLIDEISQLEPFGNANPEPILKSQNVLVTNQKLMGADLQHLKLTLSDDKAELQLLAFNAPAQFLVEPGQKVNVWFQPVLNQWNGYKSVEGRLVHLELLD